ncbi:MAG: hypothetical protein KatS3mg105_1024 [Gemmatales bacterium]|nr:MAG: hypothetical protein KatS3mg105_1024 [Gemmatales bacterium]
MLTKTRVPLLVVALVFWMAPTTPAQDYAPPLIEYPVPLGPVDQSGLFLGVEFLYWRQTNPIDEQLIATRGFFDSDGSITGNVGQFLGNNTPALDAKMVSGPENFQLGYNAFAGWRFRNGLVMTVHWWHLEDTKLTAGATLASPLFRSGTNLADTFITAPVFNFPPEYAGQADNTGLGNLFATYGIWNAASVMTIQFNQRYDQFDLRARVPMFQTDDIRCYGLLGPRHVAFWERFKWRTVSFGVEEVQTANGPILASVAGPDDVAIYSNVVSNRLYGGFLGAGTEYRLGDTPMGTFSISLEGEVALYADIVKARAKYERGDRFTSAHRTQRRQTFVPQVGANAQLWWYPIEGVQIRIGYNFMAFFNTIASPKPVSFDFGLISPGFERQIRLIDGLNAGIAIIF